MNNRIEVEEEQYKVGDNITFGLAGTEPYTRQITGLGKGWLKAANEVDEDCFGIDYPRRVQYVYLSDEVKMIEVAEDRWAEYDAQVAAQIASGGRKDFRGNVIAA
jgi:hypothetical protein